MIYDYYCMDCGNKFKGEEIRFDLGEIIGVRSKEAAEGDGGQSVFSKNEAMLIDVEKLKELAVKSKVKLVHGEKVRLCVTLRDFLKIMGGNVGEKENRATLMTEMMEESRHDELKDILREVYRTSENAEVEDQEINAFKARLDTAFPLSEDAENFIRKWEEAGNLSEAQQQTIRNIRSSMENYIAYVYIVPEFFENGKSDKLYSIRYTRDKNAATMMTPAAPTEIRGYCPKCGKPVLKNAGKCPHEMIGLLGVQSAGKTSLVVAMVRELQNSFEELGVAYPGQLLCDSRYRIMQDNFELYDNGWAVGKTPILGTGGTFNATLFLSSPDNRIQKLVTFADIAGELCYDINNKAVNIRAFNEFPLVKACDMYIMCTCIDQSGYGNADGVTVKKMPPEAPLDITFTMYDEIYKDNVAKGRRIPPLCIVLTKTDMVTKPNFVKAEDNPVYKIKTSKNYQFASPLENLGMTYDSFKSVNIREPIRRACTLYNQMSGKTYISMMSCSALGRKGTLYSGNIDEIVPYMEDGEEMPFERVRLKDLWNWILKVSGLTGVDAPKGYLMPAIPSYKETYSMDNQGRQKNTFNGNMAELRKRLACVSSLFLNQSDLDGQLMRALSEPVKKWPWQREDDVRMENIDSIVESNRAKI